MFNPLNSSTNQQLLKNNYYNQSSPYENYRWFLLQKETITCLPQNWQFMQWEKIRKWDTDPGRMHCVYSSMAKGISQAEAKSNSEKIKPVTLVIVKLRESEGISQAVSQSVKQVVSYLVN